MADELVLLEVTLPWPSRSLSPNGRHAHFMSRSRAVRRYRDTAYVLALQARPRPVPAGVELRVALLFSPPCVRSRDEDNLVASMKSGLDGVAKAMRLDDSRFRLDPPQHGAVVAGGAVTLRVYTGGAR